MRNQYRDRLRPCSAVGFAPRACRFRSYQRKSARLIFTISSSRSLGGERSLRTQYLHAVIEQDRLRQGAGEGRIQRYATTHATKYQAIMRRLALLLLVLRVLADDHYAALAANDLALLTDRLYRRSYPHCFLPPSKFLVGWDTGKPGDHWRFGHKNASARF